MKDMVGNKIHDGSLVFWKEKGMLYRVAKASDGGLSVVTPDGPKMTPPFITLQITLPIKTDRPNDEPTLTDFLCVLDPQATAAIEGMMQ